MKNKINLRLGVIAMIAILATTLGLTAIYYRIFQNRVISDLQTNAHLLSDTGLFQELYLESGHDPAQIDRESLIALNTENLRITWIDDNGIVLYDNDTDVSSMGNHLDRPEIKQALATGAGQSIRNSDTQNMNIFYYALLLDDHTVLRISTQAHSITSVILSSMPIILVILAVILGLCILIGHLLTVQLIRPINKMAEQLDHIDKLEYHELEPFAEKIRSQHEKILEAAKNRQDFTAAVSHELKTPLTAISGYAELLENGMIDSSQEKHVAEEIRHNSNRLLSLINDIIRLSELDHNELQRKFEPVNLFQLAEMTCHALRVSADRRNISLTCTGTDTVINGDRELLKELLENLIENAIRYNREGGWVRVNVSGKDGQPFLLISDNGIGIPAEHQERVFERFYRVDKSRSRETGGTGLGLAIVKHIAEIHKAKIELESKDGNGTAVKISF